MQFETSELTQIQYGYAMLDANRYGGNRCVVFRLEVRWMKSAWAVRSSRSSGAARLFPISI